MSSLTEEQFPNFTTAPFEKDSLDLSNLISTETELDFSFLLPENNQQWKDTTLLQSEVPNELEAPNHNYNPIGNEYLRNNSEESLDDLFPGLDDMSPPALVDGGVSSPTSTNVSPEVAFMNMVPPSEAAAPFNDTCYPRYPEDPFWEHQSQYEPQCVPQGREDVHSNMDAPPLPSYTPPQPAWCSPGTPINPVVHVTPPLQTNIPRVVKQTSAKVLARRARNTEAARRSRSRAKSRIQELENMVSQLQRENEDLKGAH